jgi:sporulation protein YlmC with PRC-barrel domain
MPTYALTSRITIAAATGSLLALGAATALSQDKPESTVRVVQVHAQAKPASLRCWKGADIIGMQVRNAENKDLGTIEDLAIDRRTGHVRYAVLSFGGMLGLGDKWFAIPWHALTRDPQKEALTLEIDKERLSKADGFDKDKWPDMADQRWAADVHRQYGQPLYWRPEEKTGGREYEQVSDEQVVPAPLVKGSALIGKEVQNGQNERLGEIKELVIDPDRGRIAYAVVSFDGFVEGDKLFAVPLAAFDRNASDEHLVLQVPKTKLQNAPVFAANTDLRDRSYIVSVYDFYTVPVYFANETKAAEQDKAREKGDDQP